MGQSDPRLSLIETLGFGLGTITDSGHFRDKKTGVTWSDSAKAPGPPAPARLPQVHALPSPWPRPVSPLPRAWASPKTLTKWIKQ